MEDYNKIQTQSEQESSAENYRIPVTELGRTALNTGQVREFDAPAGSVLVVSDRETSGR